MADELTARTPGPLADRGPVPLVRGVRPGLRWSAVADERSWYRIGTGDESGIPRLRWLLSRIQGEITGVDLVVMLGAETRFGPEANAEEMAGLRIGVRLICHELGIPCAVVPPYALRRYATGNPHATRGAVRTAVADVYAMPSEGGARYELAEAYVLAAMGLHWTGWPLHVLPDRQREALAYGTWPMPMAAWREE